MNNGNHPRRLFVRQKRTQHEVESNKQTNHCLHSACVCLIGLVGQVKYIALRHFCFKALPAVSSKPTQIFKCSESDVGCHYSSMNMSSFIKIFFPTTLQITLQRKTCPRSWAGRRLRSEWRSWWWRSCSSLAGQVPHQRRLSSSPLWTCS